MCTAAGQVSDDAREQLRKQIAVYPMLKAAEPLVDTESAYVTVHETGGNVQAKLVATFPDEAKAKAAQQAGTGLLALAKVGIITLGAQAPADFVKTANAVLEKTNIEQQSREVHVSMEVESSAVITFFEFVNKKGR